MTQAVCYKCGAIKFGAFCPCTECEAVPATEDDLVISMAMTDHYFDLPTLEQIGQTIRDTGTPPDLHPETRQNLLETIRSAGDLFSRTGDISGLPTALLPKKKPWWRFW